LISDRPYRKGWEPDKIRQYLIENKAIMFDPDLVDIFIKLIDQKLMGKELEDDEDCWL
jgi:HD-GYP domain-containing protein (c-di-GMP phosphodiesterase class II)